MRLHIRLTPDEAFSVNRIGIGQSKLVYFIIADKKIDYDEGRSRIAYIGTTKNGGSRVASSAAYRAEEVLRRRGIYQIHTRIITCRPRQRVKTWRKLESACLLAFRERFGEVPLCNVHGKGIVEKDEFTLFSLARINRVIDDLS